MADAGEEVEIEISDNENVSESVIRMYLVEFALAHNHFNLNNLAHKNNHRQNNHLHPSVVEQEGRLEFSSILAINFEY